jgi:hypothetical protein
LLNKNLLEPDLGKAVVSAPVACRSCGQLLSPVGLYDQTLVEDERAELICIPCWKMLWESFTRVAILNPWLMYLHNWESDSVH